MAGLASDLLPRDEQTARLLGVRLHALDAAIEHALARVGARRAAGRTVRRPTGSHGRVRAMTLVHCAIEIAAPPGARVGGRDRSTPSRRLGHDPSPPRRRATPVGARLAVRADAQPARRERARHLACRRRSTHRGALSGTDTDQRTRAPQSCMQLQPVGETRTQLRLHERIQGPGWTARRRRRTRAGGRSLAARGAALTATTQSAHRNGVTASSLNHHSRERCKAASGWTEGRSWEGSSD